MFWLKGDRDDEINRKRLEAHSSSNPQPRRAICRDLSPASIPPVCRTNQNFRGTPARAVQGAQHKSGENA
jgi:hypothetical protein